MELFVCRIVIFRKDLAYILNNSWSMFHMAVSYVTWYNDLQALNDDKWPYTPSMSHNSLV